MLISMLLCLQVFYTSKDGTRVPMFIVTPTGVPKDGTAAALQYGYGGFSHAMDPFFSPAMLTFVKHYGMRLVVANIRGGAEYGEEWHEAGTKERKQNVSHWTFHRRKAFLGLGMTQHTDTTAMRPLDRSSTTFSTPRAISLMRSMPLRRKWPFSAGPTAVSSSLRVQIRPQSYLALSFAQSGCLTCCVSICSPSGEHGRPTTAAQTS